MTRSQSSIARFSMRDSVKMPALLMRMSTRPKRPSAGVRHGLHAPFVAHVRPHEEDLAAMAPDAGDDLGGSLLRHPVGDDDVGAFRGQKAIAMPLPIPKPASHGARCDP